MSQFIINKNQQANGDYEVHNVTAGCTHMPQPENQIDLGIHMDCHSAVAHARTRWPHARINGCYYCAKSCHTS